MLYQIMLNRKDVQALLPDLYMFSFDIKMCFLQLMYNYKEC